jgi:hypothetical protein
MADVMREFFINTDKTFNERFTLGKFMEFLNEDNYDPLNSNVLNQINKLPQEGFFTYNDASYRPDLAAEQAYGDNQYWWVILVYNGLSSADDLLRGAVLKYPSLSTLEDLYFTLKLKQGDV